MTEKAEFLKLERTADSQGREQAMRMANALYARRERVHLYTGDHVDVAQALDKELWHLHDHSFVPHAIFERAIEDADKYPLMIGSGDGQSARHWPVLIHFAPSPMVGIERYTWVHYLILDDPQSIADARNIYRQFRDSAVELRYHAHMSQWQNDLGGR